MIRAILLTSVVSGALAALAPTAQAGDFSLIFGIGDRHGNTVRVRHDRAGHRERVSSHRRHHRHTPRYRVITERVWVSGHYDRVAYQARVAGVTRRVRVAARYEWRTDDCGRRYRVVVRRSHYDNVREPDRYVTRYKRVFHPGRFETRTRKIRI